MKRLRSCRGLSLLEMVMAMALAGMILTSMSAGFTLALQNWEDERNRSELLQHARLAMQRITSELRYAAGIGDRTDPDMLEFYTRNLTDNDFNAEGTIYLRKEGYGGPTPRPYALMRGVKDNPGVPLGLVYFNPMAGWPAAMGSLDKNINVAVLTMKYYKISGENLIELVSTDPSYLVDVVEVYLRMEYGTDFVALRSRVRLRNH